MGRDMDLLGKRIGARLRPVTGPGGSDNNQQF